MKSVAQFILGLDGQQKAIVSYLDHHLTDYHGLSSSIKYRIPFYQNRKWICYLNPIRNDGVELVFLKGRELSNVQKLLNHKDRKMVAGIEIFNLVSIPEKEINEIVQEALLLDEMSS